MGQYKYAITMNAKDGTPIEPRGLWTYHTRKLAEAEIKGLTNHCIWRSRRFYTAWEIIKRT